MPEDKPSPHNPSAETPQQEEGAETFSLSIKENVDLDVLYQQLATLMHNVRITRLSEADTEEFEAIKQVAESDTQELKTVYVPPLAEYSKAGDPNRELIDQEKKSAAVRTEREQRQRKEQNVRDTMRQIGGRHGRGGPSSDR